MLKFEKYSSIAASTVQLITSAIMLVVCTELAFNVQKLNSQNVTQKLEISLKNPETSTDSLNIKKEEILKSNESSIPSDVPPPPPAQLFQKRGRRISAPATPIKLRHVETEDKSSKQQGTPPQLSIQELFANRLTMGKPKLTPNTKIRCEISEKNWKANKEAKIIKQR